jgi:ATP-dependent helicase/nuclease subunit A
VYSAAQKKALAPKHSIWLSANAGTGKTQVLTGRVLRLLLEDVAPQKILCVTFTNAAAAEMSARIRYKIAEWVQMDEAALQHTLTDILERKAEAKHHAKARALFAEVVDRPDALNIKTLHGFCQSLLAQFPLEAGISPGFRVLDEEEATQLKKTVFAQAVQQPQLRSSIHFLAAQLRDNEIFELIEKACHMQKKLRPILAETQEKLKQNVHADISINKSANLQILAKAWEESESKEERPRGIALRQWLEKNNEAHWQEYVGIFTTQKGEPLKRLVVAATAKKYPALEQIARDEQQRALEIAEQMATKETAERTLHLLNILESFFELLDAEKAKAQALEYDDLITKTKALLESQEASLWVRYKLEGGIHHLLLDEAQDTSPEQWAIIEAICDDFFAGEGITQADRTLFVVGDPKQSIYRFQGADTALFHGQQAVFQARALAAQKQFAPETLVLSYRSTESVLRVVDSVLAHPNMQQRLGETLYPKHDIHRKKQAGQVVLLPIISEEKEAEDEGWILPDSRKIPADPQRKLVAAICDTVAQWLKEGRMLEAKGRPIHAGDILILMRERGVLMDRLVRGLKQRGVAVGGADRLKLKQHIWVQDLLALARFLLLPGDDFSLACILKSPLVGLQEDDLYALSHARGDETLWQRLQNSAHQETIARLKEYLRLTDFLPPFELFMHVLETDGAATRAMARLGEESEEITRAFLDQALEYEKTHTPSLEGFVQWMEQREVEIVRTAELAGDKLRILTIHSAKGLQAPVVILADAARSLNTQAQRASLYMDDEHFLWLKDALPEVGKKLKEHEKSSNEAENARKLYVALTRAEDELYITGWQTLSGAKDEWWAKTVADVMEQEKAEEILAPHAFCGRAKRLYNPQQEVAVPKVAREKTTHTISLPKFLSQPAAKEEIVQAGAVTRSAAQASEAITRGIEIHRQLELGAELSPEVMRVMVHPEFAAYFDPAVSLAEVPVRSAEFSGRIDRLVVLPEEVIILDFKTAREVPRIVPVEYQRQMETYRKLLAPLYPGRIIRAGLLYTATPEILWLDFAG